MKKYSLPQLILLVLFSTFILYGCQDQSSPDLKTQDDPQMDAAIAEAEEYLSENNPNANRGRFFVAVTVLKYVDGQMYYATNTDKYRGYQEVGIETVTATIKPGGYVFWYAASGLDYITDIALHSEADPNSALGTLTSESTPSRLWLVKIPDEVDDDSSIKYDIHYRTSAGVNDILDPKIRITTTN